MTAELTLVAATAPEFRSLEFRYHDPRPRAGGIAFVEHCIEQQLAAVLDQNDIDSAYRMLTAWNPALDTEAVQTLLDIAHDVALAEVNGPAEYFYTAVDEYCTALRRIALKVRTYTPACAR